MQQCQTIARNEPGQEKIDCDRDPEDQDDRKHSSDRRLYTDTANVEAFHSGQVTKLSLQESE